MARVTSAMATATKRAMETAARAKGTATKRVRVRAARGMGSAMKRAMARAARAMATAARVAGNEEGNGESNKSNQPTPCDEPLY